MSIAYILDTETNGENGEVIQLALARCDLAENGVVMHTIGEFFFRFQSHVSYGGLAVHRILPFLVEEEPPFSPDYVPEMDFMIGHNIDYDWKVVGAPNVKRICTLAMGRVVFPDCDSHKLGALYCYISPDKRQAVDFLKHAHNAAADVHMTLRILEAICRETDIHTLDALYAFSEECRVPSIMAFGKFSGMPVEAVDNGWRAWYKRTDNPDPYLLEAFKRHPYNPLYRSN